MRESMVLVCLIFLVLLHSFPSEAEQIPLCEGGNYTPNSTFSSNLNLLLSNLSSSNSIFSTATIGVSSADRIYGLVLCRGDLDPSTCAACYAMLSQNVTQLCPNCTRATVWDRDCELRYSNVRFFGSLDATEVYDDRCLVSNMDTTASFANMSRLLFRNASYRAAFNSSLMFATGMLSYSESQIFSLAQCTMDLSKELCSRCLNQLLDFYWNNCSRVQIGIWLIAKSCNYRYEITPFYAGDPTVLLALPLFSPPPPSLVSPPATTEQGKKNTHKVLVIVISLEVVLILITALFFCFWRRSKKTAFDKVKDIVSAEPLLFDLRTLEVATDNFSDSNRLGRGGFGEVYKGILPDGQEIAVKRLSATSTQGLGELKNELVLLARLRHKNLVRLRGICLEEEEKLLVYQYAPNRSLDTFFNDPIKCLELSWARRFEIIEGIAKGLRYLHEESHLKVIHRDLKASNILLDADLNPKISDFGLARLFGVNETHNITSKVVGTFGYMAPEYAMRGQFSVKLDVFSFGVLILEIVTGRKNNSYHDSEPDQDLLSYAWEHWREETTLEIVDPTLGNQFSSNEALRCIQIGLLCVQDVPANRPLMSSIVLMLQSPLIDFQPLMQPTGGDRTSKLSSVNDVTISELYPR